MTAGDNAMNDFTDYGAKSKQWSVICHEHTKLAEGNAIVSELLDTLDHDVKQKLYFDLLESTEELIFNELATDHWSELGSAKKNDILLSVAEFVKNNCKYYKIANIAIRLSRELSYSDAVGLLRYFRQYCSKDATAEFIIMIEEANCHAQNDNHELLERVFPLCELKMNDLISNPTYQTSGNVLSAAVSAQFYSVAYKFHLASSKFTRAYNDLRLLVQYKDIETMDNSERVETAIALMLISILAENIFAFGEIMEQPLILWLQTTQSDIEGYDEAMALLKMLKSFDAADPEMYEDAHSKIVNGGYKQSTPLIQNATDILKLKFQLMTLLDICFKKPRGNIVISFDEVCKATHINDTVQIQHLLIKAIGKKLLFGTIDAVEQTMNVTKTHPQAINAERAAQMSEKFGALITRADQMHKFMNDIAGSTILNADTL